MPELPEVETVRQSLLPHLPGRKIVKVEVRDTTVLRGQSSEHFRTALTDQRYLSLCRHGKLMYFPLQRGSLMVHLGMTGQLTVRLPDRKDTAFTRHRTTGLERTLQHPPDKHTHLSLHLDNGAVVHYRDVRKFGRVFHIEEQDRAAVVSRFRLGVDPLTDQFCADYMKRGLWRRKAPVKAVLLDQNFLAGLGNIYVDEALFRAGIRPGRGAHRVRGSMLNRLTEAIPHVLNKGLAAGGTTLKDFVDGQGQSGYNQEGLLAYGRYGQPCSGCQRPLRRGEYAGRTTTWCGHCQA